MSCGGRAAKPAGHPAAIARQAVAHVGQRVQPLAGQVGEERRPVDVALAVAEGGVLVLETLHDLARPVEALAAARAALADDNDLFRLYRLSVQR